MAIRKTVEDAFTVRGTRDKWLQLCKSALESQGFSAIHAREAIYQISAAYRGLTIWGDIQVTLFEEGEGTKIVAKATAAVDNLYAAFKSPNQRILEAFKTGIVS